MRLIRPETRRDHAAIRVVHRAAFGQEDEGNLVDRLRSEGLLVVSLVAEEEEEIVVGHVAFSDLRIDTERGTLLAVALAPVGVVPEWQRLGIGSELIREGMAACAEQGRVAAFVVGHPAYYPRFGFSNEITRRFKSEYSNLGNAYMGAELVEGSLRGLVGFVRYPKALSSAGS